MLTATLAIAILDLSESYNDLGEKEVTGQCTFYHGDRRAMTIPFSATGNPAISIADAGIDSYGVAFGYLKIEDFAQSECYREKECRLVIRQFQLLTASPFARPLEEIST